MRLGREKTVIVYLLQAHQFMLGKVIPYLKVGMGHLSLYFQLSTFMLAFPYQRRCLVTPALGNPMGCLSSTCCMAPQCNAVIQMHACAWNEGHCQLHGDRITISLVVWVSHPSSS